MLVDVCIVRIKELGVADGKMHVGPIESRCSRFLEESRGMKRRSIFW